MHKLSIIERLKLVAVLSLSLFLISIGAYFFISENIVFRFIKTDTSSLNKIGDHKKQVGQVKRRFYNDMLWIPIQLNNSIYNLDRIKTYRASQIELELFDKTLVTIFEDSLVILKINNGIPNIFLSAGKVEVEIGSSNKVTIEDEDESKTFIKKDDKKIVAQKIEEDLESEEVEQEAKVEPPKKEDKKQKKDDTPKNTQAKKSKKSPSNDSKTKISNKNKNSDDDSEGALPSPVSKLIKAPQTATDNLKNKRLEKANTQIPINIVPPYPPINSHIFFQTSSHLYIYVEKVCPDKCTLQVTTPDGTSEKIDFVKGESPFSKVKLNGEGGTYKWSYNSDSLSLVGHFKASKISKDGLKNAIDELNHIEIID